MQQVRQCSRCEDRETTEWHRVTHPHTGRPVWVCHFCYHTIPIEGW